MAGAPLDLRGRVIITDAGATSTLRRIGGALGAVGAQTGVASRGLAGTVAGMRDSARTMRALRTVGGGHGAYVGLGATGGALAFLRNEYDYQSAMNRTQAILNETDETAFKPHRELVVDLAKRYPATSAEIAKGASELAMAGMSMKQVNEVLEATVQGALATGESIKNVGMGVTDVALGLGMKLTKENFEELNNIMAAASTSYSQDYMQFLAGFYKTAPLARMVGMDVRQLAGTLGILADAGFKAEKGGTALRTSIINAAAPTPKAMAQLEKYGISLARHKQRVDTFQLGGERGAKSLSDVVATELGIDSEDLGLDKVLLPILSNEAAFGNPAALKKQLTAAISGALGIDDPESTKLVAESVNRFVESGFQQLDFDGLLREMAEKGFDKDLIAMEAMFKKRFAAPMGAVINALRDGTFESKMDIFLPRIAGAVERFADILMKGLPGAVQRLAGAFDGLMRAMASSGAVDAVVGAMNSLRDGLNSLSETNPGVLKGITLALIGLGVLAPVGFALAGVAAGFSVLFGVTAGILRFTGALWAMRRALAGIRSLLGVGAAAAAGGAGMGGMFGMGAGGLAAGMTAKEAAKALGRMGSATASGRMIGGMSAAGAAAASAAGKAGWLGRFGGVLGRLGSRALLPLGLGLMGWDAWQGYQKDGWKGALLNPLTLGLYSGGDANATELPAVDVDQGAGGLDIGASGQQAVGDAQALREQLRQIFASLPGEMYAIGHQFGEQLAAGITASGALAIAAANNVANQVRAAGQKVQLNTGPNMMPAR